MLIPSGLIFIVAFLATITALSKRQYDNAFTRFCVTLFYFSLTIYPTIPIETTRELNRWFWILVLGVEVIWYCLTKLIKWLMKLAKERRKTNDYR